MRLDQFVQNPKGLAVKKFMFDILGQKYADYEDLLERLTTCMVTDKDLMAYSKMISDIYEVGYYRAVSDYKEQLSQMGISVTVGKKTQG